MAKQSNSNSAQASAKKVVAEQNKRTYSANRKNKEVKNKNGKNGSKNTDRNGQRQSSSGKVASPETRQDKLDNSNEPFFNKPSYYYKDEVEVREISTFSFNQLAGHTDFRLKGADAQARELDLPTIMTIPFNPCPGVTPFGGDHIWDTTTMQQYGINNALRQWWAIITARTGRQAVWTQNDLGALLLAEGELISTLEFLRRVIGCIPLTSIRQSGFPQCLIEAQGVDYYDLVEKANNYRAQLNSIIININKLTIPKNIEYFKKCQDFYEKLYADDASPMAQIYIPVPATTWMLDEEACQKGTVLRTKGVFIDCTSTNNTSDYWKILGTKPMSYYLTLLADMVNAIYNSATYNAIQGDMLNAAATGTIELWSFELIPEEWKTEIEINPYFSMAVHNMNFTGTVMDGTRESIYTHINQGTNYNDTWDWGTPSNDVVLSVNDNAVIYNPSFKASPAGTPYTPVIFDLPVADPGTDERIEAGIFKTSFFGEEQGNIWPRHKLDDHNCIWNTNLPDHYAVCAVIFGDSSLGQKFYRAAHQLHDTAFEAVDFGGIDISDDADACAYLLSKFNQSPLHFTYNDGDKKMNMVGDLQFWTILDREYLNKVSYIKFQNIYTIT